MTSFHQKIQDAGGLFFLASMEMRRKRESYPSLPSEVWYAAPVGENAKHPKRTGRPVAPTPVFEFPVKKIIPVGILSMSDDEIEIPEVTADDPQEVCQPIAPIQAGDDSDLDEPEFVEALPVEDAAGDDE
jgi:hypothetical protein